MNNRLFGFVLSTCVVVYIISMWQIPVIDIDAAQYASMSREMMENGSYLKLYDLGFDYLDKPPMLFWLSSVSLSIFGVFDWAYRLPSVLMLLLGIYATYQFTLLFYQRTIAQLAAIILASSQAVFLMVHDVRCDTMLLGWGMFSIWQLAAWYQNNQWKHFFLAFAAIAGGMMTKGPIALMIPVFAFVPHFALRREWKQFFRWQYIPGLLIVAILLIPMSIGLYQQFDMEPGKVFHGRAIQSGLRFYYWTQSFGRYTGENVFNEMNHFTFLLENMLWSFLPWILFFLVGLLLVIRQLIQQKCRIGKEEEWISAGGFIITYCILARSQAQLPHYIFVVLPLAAIITARTVHTLLFEKKYPGLTRLLFWIHAVIFLLLWVAAIVLMVWPFPEIHWVVKAISILGLLVYGWVLIKPGGSFPKLMRMAMLTVIGVNLCLATGFYPHLLQYQFGNTVAKVLDEKKINKERVVLYNIDESRALHFYGNHIFQRKTDSLALQSGDILITRKESLSALQQRFPKLNTIFEGAYYGVSMLSLPFLNPETRDKETVPYVLVVLNGQP